MKFSSAITRAFFSRSKTPPARVLQEAEPPAPTTWETGFTGRAPDVDWNLVHDMGLHDIGNDPQEKEPGGYGPRTQGVFHPSAGLHPDGGGCPRAVLFDLMHAQRSPTKILTNVLKSMDNGTARHAGMQKLFVHMAQKRLAGLAAVYQDVRLSHPPAAIGGSADMIVVMQSGAVYLIDIKTASPAKFKNLFKPAWNHVLQVNTYMGMAGVRTAYVLTEDRATLEFAKPNSKFRVDFNSTLWDETLGYCHGMLRTLRTERLPAYDEATCKSNLMFCDYEAVCVAERRGLAAFGVIDRRPAEVKKHHLRIIK